MFGRKRHVYTKVGKVVDALLFAFAFWLTHWLRSLTFFDPERIIRPFSEYAWLLLVVAPLAPPLLEVQGFYRRGVLGSQRRALWILLRTSAYIALAAILVLFFRKTEGARLIFALYVPVAFGVMWAKESLLAAWNRSKTRKESLRRRVILVGSKDDAGRLERLLGLRGLEDVEVMDRVDLNESSLKDLGDRIHAHSANAVLVAPRHSMFGQIEATIHLCELEGVEVWLLADFFQTRISQTSIDDIHGHPMLVFRSGPDASWQALGKGVIDFVGGCILLLAMSPVMLAAALAVRLSSPGPVLFRQQRAGLNGRPFTMFKFRSMVTNAEQLKQELAALNEMSGPVFKVTNDPRITRVGKFLRKWSIDELPQLLNVVRGEMSLVGPRPLPLDEVARFDDLAHRRRLSVPPGLTCLWQVSGRNDVKDFKEWVRLDLEYIDNWSLWLDIKILLRTIPAVFTGAGAK